MLSDFDGTIVTLSFAPLLPMMVLYALCIVIGVLLGFALIYRQKGSILRVLAFALITGYVANPIILSEKRTALQDTVVIVVDRTISQLIGTRMSTANALRDDLKRKLGQFPNIDVRVIEVGQVTSAGHTDGSYLMGVVTEAISDIRPEQISGVLLITDGQVHDVGAAPPLVKSLPIHALLTGQKNESDRQVIFKAAPKYGLVGNDVVVSVIVKDTMQGVQSVRLTATYQDGTTKTVQAKPGQTTHFDMPIQHGGANIFKVEADRRPGELTYRNNQAHLMVKGVRDRLKVLLISGEPHTGERVWRNLLKSDPAVELVHFTILRPPPKRDNAPVRELSLIAFPTRQLFRDRLNEFDLIIFDRYARKGVLSSNYFTNMADYVTQGGSILVAAGPSFVSPLSLARSPLADILPATPTDEVLRIGYKPQITEDGLLHPITAKLAAQYTDKKTGEPIWGRWFRIIPTESLDGQVLMEDESENPLVIVSRVEEGRVAQVMSDHMWLWSRNVEGGGPQTELLRRLVHWLMKEPELEEERLSAYEQDGRIVIEFRSLESDLEAVTVTPPLGKEKRVQLSKTPTGLRRGSLASTFPGLYRIHAERHTAGDLTGGEHSTVVVVGRANPLEFEDMRTTQTLLQPLMDVGGGGIYWESDGAAPDIHLVKGTDSLTGRNWLGIRDNQRFMVTGAQEVSLIPGWLALSLAACLFAAAWYRESLG